MSALSEAAVHYAELGFEVLACQPGTKVPLAGTHGLKDASSNVERIRDSWSKAPNNNIGLRCGIKRGGKKLVVIDVDPRNNGDDTLAALISKHGPLPETASTLTGGGGAHYFFLCPDDINFPSTLGAGIDFKSNGGYVVAPPSIHPCGKPYEWEASSDLLEGAQIADLPEWVIHDFARTAPAPDPAPASKSLAPTLVVIPEIIRDLRSALLSMRADDRVLWIAVGHALKELGEQGRALWMEWSAQSKLFDSRDAAEKWDSFNPENTGYQAVFKKAQEAGWLNPLKNIVPNSTTPMAVPRPQVVFHSQPKDEPTLVRIDDVFETPPEPPEFIVAEIIPRRVVTLLSANGGIGKTTLALEVAVCTAMGFDFLGKHTQQCKVLFYSGEDEATQLRYMISKLCRHFRIDPHELAKNLVVMDATNTDPALFREVNEAGVRHGTVTPAYQALRQFIDDQGIVFVIIDNASDVYDANEIERRSVRAFIRALAHFVKQRNGAVLLLAHVDKSTAQGGASNQGYSGSTAWNNSVRSRLFMAEIEGFEVVLQHQKSNRGKKAEPLPLCWEHGVLELAGEGTSPAKNLISGMDTIAVLALIDEFYQRGEFISTATNSPETVFKKLHKEAGFPIGMTKDGLTSLMRKAERDGKIVREKFRNSDRKEKERWALPSAPACADSAPTE